ncbi:MAG TPA: thioredoxin-like domain-containing protein [Bryobacteraceae bacterium]|nr:thioredoxin-like domain-containing protein [Bryobacteraceae bacterium]
MKKFLIGLVVVFGIFQAIKELRPKARFNTAEGALQVERLGTDGAVVHEEFQPRRAPYLAVYHGAGWCPPCQQFSPRLAEFYHDADKANGRFQLVMVNYDQSDADMISYMRQHRMEFPALRRNDAGGWGAATGEGIPNLIIINTATGRVVTSSFDGSTYVGCDAPLAVLRTIVAQGHP